MRQLNEILEEIADSPAVRFSALVTKDGFVVETSSSATEADGLAASRAAQLLYAADATGEELQSGEARQVIVKYQSSLLVVDCIDSDTLLVTAVASEASMAWVKYAVGKCMPEINQRL